MPRLLIAASGTGGHIFPALALANSLPDSWKVYWMGSQGRLDEELVPKEYELCMLKVSGLQGKPWRKIIRLFRLFLVLFFWGDCILKIFFLKS